MTKDIVSAVWVEEYCSDSKHSLMMMRARCSSLAKGHHHLNIGHREQTSTPIHRSFVPILVDLWDKLNGVAFLEAQLIFIFGVEIVQSESAWTTIVGSASWRANGRRKWRCWWLAICNNIESIIIYKREQARILVIERWMSYRGMWIGIGKEKK